MSPWRSSVTSRLILELADAVTAAISVAVIRGWLGVPRSLGVGLLAMRSHSTGLEFLRPGMQRPGYRRASSMQVQEECRRVYRALGGGHA